MARRPLTEIELRIVSRITTLFSRNCTARGRTSWTCGWRWCAWRAIRSWPRSCRPTRSWW